PRTVMRIHTGRLPFGQIATHTAVPTKFTNAIGTRYFQQVDMSWSTRMRGNVARIHIIRITPKYDFTKKGRNCSRLSSTGLSVTAGTCQPPRKSVTRMALITYRLPHSTRKKNR